MQDLQIVDVLLGTIAIRFPGEKRQWNADKLRVTNNDAANKFVHHSYRKGWEVEELTI